MYLNIMYNMLKENSSSNSLSNGNLNNNSNIYYNNNENSLYEPIETAEVYDETNGGIFCDKFLLHVIPIKMNNNNNLYKNRISYNTKTNAYYENGILSNKYLKKWKERTNDIELINDDDGEISWKFDYRIGNYIINSIDLRLPLGMLNNSASIQWFIKSLPTMKNQNPTWNLIQFNQNIHHVKEIEDVTRFVKNEYGFILMARLRDDDEKQDLNKLIFFRDIDDESFGFDVRVELKPDIIIDPLPELLFSDYESINDFIIHYEFSTEDDQNIGSSGNSNKKSREFHVNSKILSERSDYFNTSIKSNDKTLVLTNTDIPYNSLKIIINYLCTGTLPNIESYDKWITLLRYSSKFLIPTLIQRCEKALKGYLNHDNLCEVENIANECDAKQLLRCCQNLNCLN
ncbi:hypothetical protein RhiirA5_503451 [Rhizophagus irregularis]|uniref:BTB domain-containing protein n=3 Tax=Rhizophagus irregularis TaxID=588596 RepID=A0A2N0P995_9GLOM|nr:hypothetical protein GLOIN_2v67533 [Rhizophagus irregularis DAOM 181602=DAOM 197198]EXX52310.1 hypothetical protein RirG_254140 [Rhizophagus irregularis DAOM 197198w]PKC03405.1 hypothetical protein RhiirA5_503451 [Rhizophagus irregularis]POG81382.1 hypothetical protein GLOIN_2v67533 [Rhizophagus irregularis DAOM 181602=DAOM 197198]UZO02873.1 hypothetical protein OCT59_021351 [Rhizophagus irregularis]GBC27370.1 BTB/POZ protein [Rhizophagus irregularis DAOM 181602=DAOM 197198]|eukprot:XP_025188248.1 hypothetical protein GLOIN_2v67533 [Rhizophagus irregularis DAOM 181602=DAOM 197198]